MDVTPGSPDIAAIAAIIGDRARAAMLTALLGGRALTATELAGVAGVSKQTASSHLAKLADARLVAVERQGRHRYVRLADHDVARAMEHLMGLASRADVPPLAVGPSDPALRRARVCYDHLAGDFGVLVLDSLRERGALRTRDGKLVVTEAGERFFSALGIDVAALRRQRRPVCLSCLDWSVRRPHLAGALGAAILERCLALGWARRQRGSRALLFPATGERAFRVRFPHRA